MLQAAPQHRAQTGFELPHRLVEEVQRGVAHQGSREAGPLLLPAGERRGVATENVLDLQERRDLRHPPLDLRRIDALRFERERDVVAHRERRI